MSGAGAISLISADFGSVETFTSPQRPEDLALSPDGSILAVARANGIALLSTATLQVTHRLTDRFQCGGFSSADLFWTCGPSSDQTLLVEVWQTGNWTRIAGATFPDPFGHSKVRLFPHPSPMGVVLWVAAGQGGHNLFWACLDGSTIQISRFAGLDNTAPPAFSPDGGEFLVVSEGELRRYPYPQGSCLGHMRWPFEDDSDPIGDYVSYAGEDSVLIASLNGRLFLADAASLTVRDEIAILDHEPRPVSEHYPALHGESSLCGDLSFFLPYPGGKFLSVHREFPKRGDPDDSEDRLLTWELS